MKKLFLLLGLLLISCSANSTSIESQTSSSETSSSTITSNEASVSNNTSSITSTNKESPSSLDNKWTLLSTIQYFSQELFGVNNKYSLDSSDNTYYIAIIYEDENITNKDLAMDDLASYVPSDFTLVENKVEDKFEDNTPLIYSTYFYNDIIVELDTYEEQTSTDITVFGQILVYNE